MHQDDIYFHDNKPQSISDLLQHKQLKPLSDEQNSEIIRISKLSTTGFSEADVREEIINPILRVLGYQKGSFSSVDREKHLRFLKTSKYVDYSLKLFDQNHWLIEAKKPKGDRFSFPDQDILQSLQYAVHPEIDAALLVLCDGELFAVFDREFDLSEPILSFKKEKLPDNIRELRILLEPWQSWFFQKRRLLKKAKRILSVEVNITRAEELSAAFDSLVSENRQTIWQNTRNNISSQNNLEEWNSRLSSCDLFEAVEVRFFDNSKTEMNYICLAKNVLQHFDKSPHSVVDRIFPRVARDANCEYWATALYFMMQADAEGRDFRFFPPWLGVSGEHPETLEAALKRLIYHCLTGFSEAPDQQIMLLLAAASRRLSKLVLKLVPHVSDQSKIANALSRFQRDELDWSQVVSSVKNENLNTYSRAELMIPAKMVKEFAGKTFKTETAKKFLTDSWRTELSILKQYPEYPTLEREQSDNEIHPTECLQVTYDYLGHLSLCLIDHFPKWKNYVLENHKEEIAFQVSQNLFKAKEFSREFELVSMNIDRVKELASNRFFLGKQEIHKGLIDGYGIYDDVFTPE